MKRSAKEIDLTEETEIDENTTDNNEKLSEELALTTSEHRVCKKPKIINEPVVEQDIIDDMVK